MLRRARILRATCPRVLRRRRPGGRALLVTAIAAAALTLASLLVAAPALAQPTGFPDVAESLPAYDAIGFLSGAGIISGYEDGDFGPGDTLKRGQATKMLVLWQKVPLVTDGPAFPDLDDVYRDYVGTAVAEGWITGYVDGRFKPYSTLTRQQMAIIMVRAMGWEEAALELSGDEADDALSVFVDQANVSDVARPYVAVAVAQGLFGGDTEGRLNPTGGITRAQFCLVVFRAELTLRSVIQDVRSASDYPDKTRVVIDLSQAPGEVTASAMLEGLLVIDYTDGAIGGSLSEAIEGSAEVTGVVARQLSYDPRSVRIILDLGRYERFRVMSLAPSEGKGYRIAVDIYRRTTGPDGDGPPLICIDPGHGGESPGATGVSGTKEKSVNLAISLPLAEDLRKAGVRVMMTRENDSTVDLHQRPAMANAAKASLFVAVHNNASGGGDIGPNGTETYYWGIGGEWAPDGKLLAEAIQRHLVEALGSLDRGAQIELADWVVLAESEMTAVLVEVGFMTNPAEEARLLTLAYQTAAARAIADGILEYLDWSTTVYSTES